MIACLEPFSSSHCSLSRRQLPKITHRVFFDVSVQGEGDIGRIVLGLFGENSPAAVQQFVELCSCEQKPCFTDSLFHRIIPYFGLQGGDITHHDGTGGVPLSAPLEMKETVKMTKPHLLAVATKGTTSATATSQFFITTVKTQWLTGKHVVLGMVLEGGEEVVNVIEKGAGTYGGTPSHTVTITQSGVLPLEDKDAEPHYY